MCNNLKYKLEILEIDEARSQTETSLLDFGSLSFGKV